MEVETMGACAHVLDSFIGLVSFKTNGTIFFRRFANKPGRRQIQISYSPSPHALLDNNND
jgi:hypothetical protein